MTVPVCGEESVVDHSSCIVLASIIKSWADVMPCGSMVWNVPIVFPANLFIRSAEKILA